PRQSLPFAWPARPLVQGGVGKHSGAAQHEGRAHGTGNTWRAVGRVRGDAGRRTRKIWRAAGRRSLKTRPETWPGRRRTRRYQIRSRRLREDLVWTTRTWRHEQRK